MICCDSEENMLKFGWPDSCRICLIGYVLSIYHAFTYGSYVVTVRTTNSWGAGTDAVILFSMNTVRTTTDIISLPTGAQSSPELYSMYFEADSTDVFTIEEDYGRVIGMVIGHNEGASGTADWELLDVSIYDTIRDITQTFYCNCWIPDGPGNDFKSTTFSIEGSELAIGEAMLRWNTSMCAFDTPVVIQSSDEFAPRLHDGDTSSCLQAFQTEADDRVVALLRPQQPLYRPRISVYGNGIDCSPSNGMSVALMSSNGTGSVCLAYRERTTGTVTECPFKCENQENVVFIVVSIQQNRYTQQELLWELCEIHMF